MPRAEHLVKVTFAVGAGQCGRFWTEHALPLFSLYFRGIAQFIDENGGGAGVAFAKVPRKKR